MNHEPPAGMEKCTEESCLVFAAAPRYISLHTTMASSCLSVAKLGVLSALLLPPSPGTLAFLVSPSLPTSPCSAAGPSCTRSASNIHSCYSSRMARQGRARMSTSPEVSDAEAAEVAAAMEETRVDPYVTELPDSFEDSIVRMGRSTLQCMEEVR